MPQGGGPNAERRPSDDADLERTRALVERIKQGDTAAFEDLVKMYKNQVAGIAYKIVGDYDDAKDITQMVFVKLYHNLKRYDPSKRFTTWLCRIGELSPADQLTYKMLKEHVLKAADRLGYKQRTAFVLRDVDGLDIAKVAEIMSMPQATVRWYLHRARGRLRADVKRRYPHLLNQLGIKV
jgi:RNA polymerase sigma-70 factor (ECF subfamily)